MSRLNSFIRRLCAQRDVLDHVCAIIAGIPGPVLEFGLGNGRTFDHLRERLPGRRIIAFDRALNAFRTSVPPEGDLVLGEIRETGEPFAGIGAALIHADIETGNTDGDAETSLWLGGLAARLLERGGIIASGLALDHPGLLQEPLPASVPAERYFIYRRA